MAIKKMNFTGSKGAWWFLRLRITCDYFLTFFFWISFQNGLSCPLVSGLGIFSLFSLFLFVEHNQLNFFFMISSNLLDPLNFLYHTPALHGQLWSLSFFALAPSVWRVILVKVILKNIIGSKWDYKGYISALWKDCQR